MKFRFSGSDTCEQKQNICNLTNSPTAYKMETICAHALCKVIKGSNKYQKYAIT